MKNGWQVNNRGELGILKLNEIHQGDCLELGSEIEPGTVDLILTDLPYGTVEGLGGDIEKYKRLSGSKWDVAIDPKEVYAIANRILRKNGKMVLFSQEPYTSRLINEVIPNIPFNYRMVWEKDHFANALLVNKAPVSYYEDILVFSKTHDTEDLHPLRNYLKECKEKSGMTNKQFNHLFSDYYNKQGCRDRSVLEHYWSPSQFMLPTIEIYEKILQPTGYFPIPYTELKAIDDQFKKDFPSTFNLWEGNKYKSNILKYRKDYDGYHPTQKPVLLLEDLIKTFSNEGDIVVDLTCGSGSTCVAAQNAGRSFIGIEKEKEYVDIANERIKSSRLSLELVAHET